MRFLNISAPSSANATNSILVPPRSTPIRIITYYSIYLLLIRFNVRLTQIALKKQLFTLKPRQGRGNKIRI